MPRNELVLLDNTNAGQITQYSIARLEHIVVGDYGIGDIEATLLGLMLPAATSVRSLEYATSTLTLTL